MNAPKLAAVLWDLDGTLIDSEPAWLEVETAMLARYGLEMSPETQRRMIGSGLWEAAEHFRELGVPMTADDIVAEWVASAAVALGSGELDWRPGARELLESLRHAGVPCALVTMSVRSLADQVAAMLPDGTFSAIVAGDEVEHAKPHPEPYLRGAAALGVPIDACLAIEDSLTGLRSAAASGAVAIGVTHLVDLTSSPADDVWSTLAGVSADILHDRFAELRGQAVPRAR